MGSLTQICLLRMDERDSGEGGGRPPTLRRGGRLWLWASVVHAERPEESAEALALLRHINGELTPGWRLPALSL